MEPSQERAVFKALLFSGNSESRAWSLLYDLLLQLKFVSDGVSVKLLAIHQQKQEVVYELSLQPGITASMKSDFVQWHTQLLEGETRAFGARFITASDADTFHTCFQQLLEAVCSRHLVKSRRSSDIYRPPVIPHPSVRQPASLQLLISLPDGRTVTEFASHSTRLRELLRKVCKSEQLPYKHHYLKPEKLRLEPEPVPLDMNLTVGEVKISKFQLRDRRSEREMSGGRLSFSNRWGGSKETAGEKECAGQIQLLQGKFNTLEDNIFSQPQERREHGVAFRSPTRGSYTGTEMVVSPVDSLDESEISAPFRPFLLEDRPKSKRSSSLRSRREADQIFLDHPLPSGSSPNPSPKSPRGTFSESDIRGAVTSLSDSKHRPSTPNRRRAPRPPDPVGPPFPVPQESLRETGHEGGTLRKSQVPVFKVSEDLTSKLQDEFSEKLSARHSRSPVRTKESEQSSDSGIGTEGNSSGDIGPIQTSKETNLGPIQTSKDSNLGPIQTSNDPNLGPIQTLIEDLSPLASSTPDKRSVVRTKPQIAPKPSKLARATHKPSFPLYPTNPAPGKLLLSQNNTVRGVVGHVDQWRALNHQDAVEADSPTEKLVFHPHTSELSESGPLVFELPPPPEDSPPPSPPPFRFTAEEFPPPMDDQSDSSSDANPSQYTFIEDDVITRIDNIDGVITRMDHIDDVITPIDHTDDLDRDIEAVVDRSERDNRNTENYLRYDDVTEIEDMIVLPPPRFDSPENSDQGEEFSHEMFPTPQFPPPTPLRMSLNIEELPDSPTPPLPPFPLNTPLDTEQGDRNAGVEKTRLAELLTAAAKSLTGELPEGQGYNQASELVRAALQLINRAPAQTTETRPEALVRASYHQTEELEESDNSLIPDFSRFGPNFQACMEDIRLDKGSTLKPSEQTEIEHQWDVAAALTKAMKERRLLLEQTSNSRGAEIFDTLQHTQSDDWK